MKLSEHPDFEQAILHAADYFRIHGLRAAFIEKDYYVSEALRALVQVAGDNVIFKGGTSLSKGWSLIERFSEDIDIFLDPQAYSPPLGTNAIDRTLKQLRDAVTTVPLVFLKNESKTFGGFGRNDHFCYKPLFGAPGEVAPRVLLESGIASGREPTVSIELHSFLGKFLMKTGNSLGASDEAPFTMRLLHFRRTFVEKLFAIHKRIELLKQNGLAIGSQARHYYDLFQLASRNEVKQMLRSEEYAKIKMDYDHISRKYFPDYYCYPEEMVFSKSDAIFPTPELSRAIKPEYEEQCKLLCYSSYRSY
jgi:hypothetical protein